MVLAPAESAAVTDWVRQLVQSPLPVNDTPLATVVPLTMMSIGRSTVVPLAKPKVSVALPAWAALTVHSTPAPTALVVLQNPVPENPAWSESMVPWQVPLSASNRFAGGGMEQDWVEPVWLIRSAPPVVLVLFCTQNPATVWKIRSFEPALRSAVKRSKVT